jgi:hypothetical protein
MIRASVIVLALAACGPGVKGGPTMSNKVNPEPAPTVASAVVSADILAREPISNIAQVKHILIGWGDLTDAYGGHQDKRGAGRNKAQAEAVVTELMDKLKLGGDFETLMQANSEDSGSTAANRPIKVTPDAGLVIEFRQLSLRLRLQEYGVCQSDFGFHIIKRYE